MGWAWICSQAFPAVPGEISRARSFLRRVLGNCPLSEDAVLICSELCTNAVRHSDSARDGGRFTVRVEVCDGDYLWLQVEDEGGQWAPSLSGDEGGRGLAIVAELADYWDVRGDDTARTVCARLDWR
jgi:serine/threonine-protein kinase RsbW